MPVLRDYKNLQFHLPSCRTGFGKAVGAWPARSNGRHCRQQEAVEHLYKKSSSNHKSSFRKSCKRDPTLIAKLRWNGNTSSAEPLSWPGRGNSARPGPWRRFPPRALCQRPGGLCTSALSRLNCRVVCQWLCALPVFAAHSVGRTSWRRCEMLGPRYLFGALLSKLAQVQQSSH